MYSKHVVFFLTQFLSMHRIPRYVCRLISYGKCKKYRKIPVIIRKSVLKYTFFHQNIHFFLFFVWFMDCLGYICEENTTTNN